MFSEKLKIFNTSSALDLRFIICVIPDHNFHAGRYLVSHEAGHMDLLARIVLGEGLGLATMALGPDQDGKMKGVKSKIRRNCLKSHLFFGRNPLDP